HGKRADAIVKNMLQHSREGSGEHRVIDINALVEESLNLAWHGARAEPRDLRSSSSNPLIHLPAGPTFYLTTFVVLFFIRFQTASTQPPSARQTSIVANMNRPSRLQPKALAIV